MSEQKGPAQAGPASFYPYQELQWDGPLIAEKGVDTNLRTLAQRVLLIPEDGRKFVALLAQRWIGGFHGEIVTARDRALHNAFHDLLFIIGAVDTPDPMATFLNGVRAHAVKKHRDDLREMMQRGEDLELLIPPDIETVAEEQDERTRLERENAALREELEAAQEAFEAQEDRTV